MAGTSLRIALRYLFSKKSRSSVTAISAVSVCGVALATAAIICVLSVFNGFHEVLGDRLSRLTSDVTIRPAEGKVFADADSVAQIAARVAGVEVAMPCITEKALAVYDGREMPVTLRGVDADKYRKISSIDSIIVENGGAFDLQPEERAGDDPDDPFGSHLDYKAVLSIGSAARLGVNGINNSRLMLLAPRRTGTLNMDNPISSFRADSLDIAGVFQSEQSDFDRDYVLTDIELARTLFEYDLEGTSVEVKCSPGESPAVVADRLRAAFGTNAVVKDSLEQQEVNFRMIQIEKWITFLLLAFILLIASFNMVSALSILVIDKRENLHTLRVMGASEKMIGAVFRWESVLVTVLGAVLGILLGTALVLLQQNFGLVKLNGDASQLVIKSYPVRFEPIDLLAVLVPVCMIGILTGWITSAFARSRVKD